MSDRSTFVQRRAFAEQVRLMIEWGLESERTALAHGETK